MNRRDFIALGGAMVAAWPVLARAQGAKPVVGFIGAATPSEWKDIVTSFNQGLNDGGYADGRNLAIEYRWAHDQYDRMPGLALDLVGRGVDVIVAGGGTRSIQAAMTATRAIPIVFISGGDPVQLGLVASLDRPAGNVTGVMFTDAAYGAKRIELIKELVPSARAVAAMVNPNNPISSRGVADMLVTGQRLRLLVHILNASSDGDLETAFGGLPLLQAGGLVVHADPFLLSRREKIVALAARHRAPAIYGLREFATSGGLVSYGTSITGVYRHAGTQTARILKGARPGELPVERPMVSELIVNRRTAKALGITLPPSLIAAADHVIE
jgi:putative ABC transport system substrate-binding protein